jgi:hypothetical protein
MMKVEAARVDVLARDEAQTIHWSLWCAVIAVSSAMIGLHWDIAWHRSIGRDSFWTPPHLMIQACGILGGVIAIGRIFFGDKRAAVRIWGFSGPLGAFICAWGAVAMISSAPFDDWWHNAYGLDVKIISPPHSLLALGIGTVGLGAVILILGAMNNAEGALKEKLSWMFFYLGAMSVVMVVAFMMELTDRSHMHCGHLYRVVCLGLPLVLVGIARASDDRWAATKVAGIFTAFQLLLLWILPLVPAEPKLGPVYYPVTHLVPPPFPLLLVAPAIAIDLIRQRTHLGGWRAALAFGGAFLGAFLVVQWPFGSFLESTWSRNWIFGTHYFDYNTRPSGYHIRHVFAGDENGVRLVINLAIALLLAIVTSRLAIGWGDWMKRVRR